ncbi:MAG: GNAT family N-acetyltransferase, partial [Elusimicrobia bacterium]|nr:GNAT family N-acetyltransferase [Elusimicrobiota bacterium]
ATEAGRLMVDHAFRRMELRRLWARLDPANRAFRHVLKKLGFRYEGCLRADKRLNGRWIDQECWGMLRSDWVPHKPAGRRP